MRVLEGYSNGDKKQNNVRLSLRPLGFREVVSDILKVELEPKEKKKARANDEGKIKE